VPKIHNVELLGHKGKLKWRQDSAALTVELPEQTPSDHAVCFRVALA
jgi:alpha-L-fucosidase